MSLGGVCEVCDKVESGNASRPRAEMHGDIVALFMLKKRFESRQRCV